MVTGKLCQPLFLHAARDVLGETTTSHRTGPGGEWRQESFSPVARVALVPGISIRCSHLTCAEQILPIGEVRIRERRDDDRSCPLLTPCLYFFALIAKEGFLICPCYSLELCIQMLISFLFCFAFVLDLPNPNTEQFSHLQAPKPVNLLWRILMQAASGQGSWWMSNVGHECEMGKL